MITCRRWFGGEILVPREKLVHRPSAYGIAQHEDTILLMTTVGLNGRFCLPGGGIEPYETNAVALQREMVEEAGIRVAVGSMAHFQEDFFITIPLVMPGMGCSFITAAPRSVSISSAEQVDDESATNPQWVKIENLHQDNLQPQERWLLDYLKSA